ncbi:hypothetical protein CFK37_06710 [Virgibacillus phasianinus]|uniref:YokE-like PH domain-containing protein n=1 Tax=Virgibacillus phasianinus TaxID=2017483 RepID=A0A220U272_9BACI|nr:hypothetical protein [Virgibacillus phasianinus]ASK61873.1 hypothetical protein CFK37_06710 [Virgibacillus phasianinus]
MYLIAEQPYTKVQREVNSVEQVKIEHERVLYLYNEKLVTQHREFPIQEVLDVSYRTFGKEGGLLYLHTSGGLFTYTVTASPQKFIDAFKEHKKKISP